MGFRQTCVMSWPSVEGSEPAVDLPDYSGSYCNAGRA